MSLHRFALAAASLLAACTPPSAEREGGAEPAAASGSPAAESTADQATKAPPDPASPAPVAAELTRIEWREAQNRTGCAPVAITGSAAVAPVNARRAQFSGGWAIAFDQPGRRSAYGVAGPGLVAADDEAQPAQETRLREQWPHFRTLDALPYPSFAGYGIEGAQPYPQANPDGRGLNSLAYVRIAGQRCTYNVWSRLGRAHLEAMLDSLRLIAP